LCSLALEASQVLDHRDVEARLLGLELEAQQTRFNVAVVEHLRRLERE